MGFGIQRPINDGQLFLRFAQIRASSETIY